ncbi:MAG TPA: ATP-binding protein, partial [Actinomycetota bacterium]|nr:ATP-binding protein [Actinomycetota bacterium]
MADAERGVDPNAPAPALTAVLEPFSPLTLFRRTTGEVVGRRSEFDAIRQELATARSGRLAGLTLEGEPGIGKTRLLLAAGEMASQAGFTTIAVTADEEL